MTRNLRQFAIFVSLASCALAQRIPPPENNFDVIVREGGIVDLHTLEEFDRTLRNQAGTRAETNLSKLDLKASGRARHEYEKGLLFFIKKDYNSAAASQARAISIYPDFVSAHNALGCSYFSLGQNDLALREFTRATELDDHLSNSFMNLGRVQLALGDTAAAQAALAKASSLSPLNANLLLALTYAAYSNHDYSAAIKTAQQAHSHSHSGIATVHYFAAASWQAQHRLEQTRAELQTFLTEDPKSPFAEQARHTIEQIENVGTQPPTLAFASGPTFSTETPNASLLGQKVLQDYKEKQEIAEAEKAETDCSTCGIGDTPPPPAAESGRDRERGMAVSRSNAGPYTFHTAVDEVAVFFTATDHGRPVSNLSQGEMTVRDDKKPPASVLGFRTESDLPLRLALIIDTSQSITDRLTFEQAAGADFLQQALRGNDDLAFVAGFSNSIVLVQDFTHDLQQLSHGINQLVSVGGTAVWDAVSFAADKLAERKETQPVARMIVVISDGDDNSSNVTLKQAIDRAQHDEVSVYTVSTRYFDNENYAESTGNHAMKALAELSGGAAFFPGSASHLRHSLADLQQLIRSRYLVSYRPALFRRDGRYRSVEITARKSGHKLKVNTRRGYYADNNSVDR